MFRKVLLMVLISVLFTGTAFAFDGNRKGFVLGGGLGVAPIAKTSVNGYSESKSGLAINLLIGYAWDDQNMIVYLEDMAAFNSNSTTIGQGFRGLGFYHYFGQKSTSFFVGGIGQQNYQSLENSSDAFDTGFGILLGGGYEFAKHFQLHATFSFGQTSVLGVDIDHQQLMVEISAIAF